MDACFRDYDIVHYHAMGNAFFSFIPRMFGKKTVVTIHGLDWEREKWGFIAKAYLKLCERAITIFPNKIIAVSNKIKQYYQKKYDKKIEFIPNGVNIEKPLKLSKLKRFGIKKNKYILFISRIVPEKGLDCLIPAFKAIKTDIKLLIVGDATHTESYLEKLKKMTKDNPRIIFAGPLYGKEKSEAYSNALFFVLPSTIEGMPIVLLEAMSYGLCPLVSNIKENVEVIGGLGHSFKNKNTIDLQSELDYLIKHANKHPTTKKRYISHIAKNYQWNTIAKETYTVYKS
jgi:glycosyltransferase involved in cell wall biosynthesis